MMMDSKLLLVSPPHRRAELLRLLERPRLQIYLASNVGEASKEISGPTSFEVVLSEADLPDGSWRDVLAAIQNQKKSTEMIVCSHCADDELWAEVLHFGAYDLIVEPYAHQEIQRIVESAIDSRYLHRFAHAVAS